MKCPVQNGWKIIEDWNRLNYYSESVYTFIFYVTTTGAS